jgi:hypothetical protein
MDISIVPKVLIPSVAVRMFLMQFSRLRRRAGRESLPVEPLCYATPQTQIKRTANGQTIRTTIERWMNVNTLWAARCCAVKPWSKPHQGSKCVVHVYESRDPQQEAGRRVFLDF